MCVVDVQWKCLSVSTSPQTVVSVSHLMPSTGVVGVPIDVSAVCKKIVRMACGSQQMTLVLILRYILYVCVLL